MRDQEHYMRVPIRPATIGLTLVSLLTLTATACSSGSNTPVAASATTVPPGSASSAAPSTSPSATSTVPAVRGSELDTYTLLTAAQASTLRGKQYSGAVTKTIAQGQDQCTYTAGDNSQDLVVVVYQPTSGVSWQMMTSVLTDTGAVTNVSGVGDKAMVGQIELDVQAGKGLVAIQGAGGNLTGDDSKAIAIAKAVIAALP